MFECYILNSLIITSSGHSANKIEMRFRDFFGSNPSADAWEDCSGVISRRKASRQMNSK